MDPIAARDQLEASAATIANMAYTMTVALVQAGFTREEAVDMVTVWLGEAWN